MMSNKQNILIVDDEPMICDSLRELLSDQDYDIRTTNSGNEALEYLDRFEIVLERQS